MKRNLLTKNETIIWSITFIISVIINITPVNNIIAFSLPLHQGKFNALAASFCIVTATFFVVYFGSKIIKKKCLS